MNKRDILDGRCDDLFLGFGGEEVYPIQAAQCGQCPSVNRRTTSRTPTVSPSRDVCEEVCLLKMKPSSYQDDPNIEPAILWIHTPHKAALWVFSA